MTIYGAIEKQRIQGLANRLDFFCQGNEDNNDLFSNLDLNFFLQGRRLFFSWSSKAYNISFRIDLEF
jgi:hypothetical protein